MQNFPKIFGDKGVFVEPDAQTLASLDEPTRARLDAVRTAYNDLLDAQAAEKAATDEITNAAQAVEDATAYRNKFYPPATQHDLWIENFGSAEAKRALALRRAGRS
jgi:hypothetical protein